MLLSLVTTTALVYSILLLFFQVQGYVLSSPLESISHCLHPLACDYLVSCEFLLMTTEGGVLWDYPKLIISPLKLC